MGLLASLVDGLVRGVVGGPQVEAVSWYPMFGGRVGRSAKTNSDPREYTVDAAMQLAAVNGAVNFLARQVGASDVTAERLVDGTWLRANQNGVGLPGWASGGRPNPRQSSYEWRQQLAENLLVSGSGYIAFSDAQKVGGYPSGFTVWPSALVSPQADGSYHLASPPSHKPGVQPLVYTPYTSLDRTGNIMHIRFGARNDHTIGVSPLGETAQALRGMLAADAHSELFFETGGMPQGFLLCKSGDMTAEKRSQMALHMRTVRENPDQRHIPLVLDGDWEYVPASTSPADAQLIDVRKYGYSIAASILGVLRQFLGAPDETSTFDRAMQKFQYDSAIAPLLRMIHWPLSELLPDGVRVRLTLDYFGDAEPLEQARYYERAVGAGWLLPSEVRAREGLPPVPGIDDRWERIGQQGTDMRDRSGDSDSSKDTGATDYPEQRT